MTEIVLVPLDADVRKAPIDRVIITTSEDLGAAFARIAAIAEATGADPAKLTAIMLADELARIAPTFIGEHAATVGLLDDPDMRDGRTVTNVGADGIARTDVLQSFKHVSQGEAGYTSAGALELRQARIPKTVQEPEFAKGQVL